MLRVTSSPASPSPRVAATDESPCLVAKADGEAVELELGDVLDRRCGRGEPEVATDSRIEVRSTLGRRVRLGADRQHRHRVAHRRERGKRRAADTLCGRIGRDERDVLALERFELAIERVVFGIADRRCVEYVVRLVVRGDRFTQRIDARCRRCGDRGLRLGRGH